MDSPQTSATFHQGPSPEPSSDASPSLSPPIDTIPEQPVAAPEYPSTQAETVVVEEPREVDTAAEPEPEEQVQEGPHFSVEPAREVNLEREWNGFLDYLMKDRPNLGSFLSFASLVGVNASAVDLRFPSSFRFQYSQVTQKDCRADVLRYLHQFVGHPIDLRITLEKESDNGSDTKSAPQLHAMQTEKVTLQDEIDKEPIIETVLEFFDGEVIN